MTPIVSFLKCLTLMTLSLCQKDVKRATAPYLKWEAAALPFLKKFGLQRDFTAVSKTFKASSMEFTDAEGTELGNALKLKMPAFVKDTSIIKEHLDLLKDCCLIFRKDSEPAWNRISRNSVCLGEPKLSAMFVDKDDAEVGDVATAQAMSRIVFALTARKNDPILTLAEMRDFRETDPKTIEKYSLLRKTFVANYKRCLHKFIRLNTRPYLDVRVVGKYLDAMGCNNLPKGFVGNVDEQGRLYTTTGNMLSGAFIGEVRMNPAYDPKTDDTYVCSLMSNPSQALRTKRFLADNKKKRFEVVGELLDDIDTHRPAWLKGLNSPDAKIEMCAALIETMYQTQARIGGEGNAADGAQTFGLTTVCLDHIKFSAQGMEFEYPGKKGTMQHHTLRATTPTNRKIITLFKAYAKNKAKTAYLFTLRGTLIKPNDVNKYLKQVTGMPKVTAHKLRHIAGTKLARELFAKSPLRKGTATQAQAEKWMKAECIKIGAMLHHRSGTGDKEKTVGTTSIASYIDPSVVKEYFTNLNLRIPKWVPDKAD